MYIITSWSIWENMKNALFAFQEINILQRADDDDDVAVYCWILFMVLAKTTDADTFIMHYE